jgi:hypothetical protein
LTTYVLDVSVQNAVTIYFHSRECPDHADKNAILGEVSRLAFHRYLQVPDGF